MKMQFEAKTRTSLVERESIVRIEQMLRDLALDFLGPKLYESSDVAEDVPLDDRTEIDSNAAGWLVRAVERELGNDRESHCNWLKSVSKEQLRLMEEQGLSPTRRVDLAMLLFVTADYNVSDGWYTGDAFTGKEVFLHASERSLVTRLLGMGKTELNFDNSLALNWLDADSADDQLSDTCLSVMQRLFDNDLFDYGYCCSGDQYGAKNLDYTHGVEAVGLDVSKCLPGFYWGNYFGSFLCNLVGTEQLLSVPGCRSLELESGVLVTNELAPDRWSEPEFVERENRAIDHIGRHLFFEKGKAMTGTLFTVE